MWNHGISFADSSLRRSPPITHLRHPLLTLRIWMWLIYGQVPGKIVSHVHLGGQLVVYTGMKVSICSKWRMFELTCIRNDDLVKPSTYQLTLITFCFCLISIDLLLKHPLLQSFLIMYWSCIWTMIRSVFLQRYNINSCLEWHVQTHIRTFASSNIDCIKSFII